MINKKQDKASFSQFNIVLSDPFRPFFLLAGLWAVISLGIWMLLVTGVWDISIEMPASLWHQHEMIFGFVAAAMAGFSLTAVPSWTNKPPIVQGKLLLLVVVWLAGRIGFLIPDFFTAHLLAVIDLSFSGLMIVIISGYVIAGKNWKNIPVVFLFISFGTGNLLVHLEFLGVADTAKLGVEISILSLLMLIAVIGGKVIPAFTANWLKRNGHSVMVAKPMQVFDIVALLSLLCFIISYVIHINDITTAILAIVAAVLNFIRLLRWKFWFVLREPLMWILHLGYLWIVVGTMLIGLSLFLEEIPETAALHSITTGTIATFILAMMTRATLGHSGRDLKANLHTVVIFIFISFSGISRIASPLLGEFEMMALYASAMFWLLAFGLFVIEYGPIILTKSKSNSSPTP